MEGRLIDCAFCGCTLPEDNREHFAGAHRIQILHPITTQEGMIDLKLFIDKVKFRPNLRLKEWEREQLADDAHLHRGGHKSGG